MCSFFCNLDCPLLPLVSFPISDPSTSVDMFASTISTPSKLNLSHFVLHAPKTNIEILPSGTRKYRRSRVSVYSRFTHRSRSFHYKSHFRPVVTARVNGDDGALDATSQQSSSTVCHRVLYFCFFFPNC